MSTIPITELGRVFVEIADTMVDEFDVVEFLQMVTAHAAELTGTHSAGLLLADENARLHFMAASSEPVHLLELFQVAVEEGPCVDCFRSGQAVDKVDLRRSADRWRVFTPRALGAGFTSAHAFPLRLRQQIVGSLGLFSIEPVELAPSDAEIVQALADIATIGILQERTIRESVQLADRLQSALDSRIIIEQAKGVLAQKNGTSIDEAFELLRSYSRRNHLRLSDLAHAVVRDPDGAPDLSAQGPASPPAGT